MSKEESPEVLEPTEDRITADYEERAESKGYRVQVFTRIEFERGAWSQNQDTPSAGCTTYTCKGRD